MPKVFLRIDRPFLCINKLNHFVAQNLIYIFWFLQYQEDSDVESLVNKLLAILDKPEKALLLRDVR